MTAALPTMKCGTGGMILFATIANFGSKMVVTAIVIWTEESGVLNTEEVTANEAHVQVKTRRLL